VFVGNLAFKTSEPELAQEFAAAGKVISANIISRGTRSLGYGFVEMESEQGAEKAVELLNKKEIDGRPINVEIAKPREEGAPAPRENSGRGRRGARRGGAGAGRGAPRGARGSSYVPRGSGGPPRTNGADGADAASKKKKPFYKGEQADEDGEGEGEEGEDRPQRFRGRRRGAPRGGPRRPSNEERQESKTTLFVANLPFKFDDAEFGKIFTDGGLTFKSAHVVKKRNGRSKGYGFVEFNVESEQQKALADVDKKMVDGRELSVKIALTENRSDDAEEGHETSKSEKKTEDKQEEKKADTPKTEKKEEK